MNNDNNNNGPINNDSNDGPINNDNNDNNNGPIKNDDDNNVTFTKTHISNGVAQELLMLRYKASHNQVTVINQNA